MEHRGLTALPLAPSSPALLWVFPPSALPGVLPVSKSYLGGNNSEMASSCTKGGLDWTSGRISSQKALQSIKEPVQGSRGGTNPGSLQKLCGCGTGGHDLMMNLVGLN